MDGHLFRGCGWREGAIRQCGERSNVVARLHISPSEIKGHGDRKLCGSAMHGRCTQDSTAGLVKLTHRGLLNVYCGKRCGIDHAISTAQHTTETRFGVSAY